MKARYLAAVSAGVLICIPVHAADMPPPAVKAPTAAAPFFNWTGWYAGISAGGAWGESRYNFGDGFTTGDFDVSGWLVGGTLGVNWQHGAVVFGLEGDLNRTDIDGSVLCPNLINSCMTGNSWIATVRGRIGYAFDNILPYLTGGVAFGDIQADIPGFGSSEGSETGWTLGAGIEFAVWDNWTAKVEYLYVDLGEFDCNAACSAIPTGTDEFRTNIVRVGLNYRFGS